MEILVLNVVSRGESVIEMRIAIEKDGTCEYTKQWEIKVRIYR